MQFIIHAQRNEKTDSVYVRVLIMKDKGSVDVDTVVFR